MDKDASFHFGLSGDDRCMNILVKRILLDAMKSSDTSALPHGKMHRIQAQARAENVAEKGSAPLTSGTVWTRVRVSAGTAVIGRILGNETFAWAAAVVLAPGFHWKRSTEK